MFSALLLVTFFCFIVWLTWGIIFDNVNTRYILTLWFVSLFVTFGIFWEKDKPSSDSVILEQIPIPEPVIRETQKPKNRTTQKPNFPTEKDIQDVLNDYDKIKWEKFLREFDGKGIY